MQLYHLQIVSENSCPGFGVSHLEHEFNIARVQRELKASDAKQSIS
jgi:hypothetical protein